MHYVFCSFLLDFTRDESKKKLNFIFVKRRFHLGNHHVHHCYRHLHQGIQCVHFIYIFICHSIHPPQTPLSLTPLVSFLVKVSACCLISNPCFLMGQFLLLKFHKNEAYKDNTGLVIICQL